VLLLRDVLGWSAREVADLLETTVAGANSALQRARATIDAEVEPHAVATPRATHERELLARYLDAWERTDIDAFVALVREDAVLRMPPGGAVEGLPALVEFWFGGDPGSKCKAGSSRLVPTRANGRPAVRVYKEGDERFAVMLLEIEDGKIAGFDAFCSAAL